MNMIETGLAPSDRRLSGAVAPRRWAGAACLAVALAAFAPAWAWARDHGPPAQLAEMLREIFAEDLGPTHYFAAQFDLNGDERPEYVVHVAGPMVCGTGGCDTLVLTEGEGGLRLIAAITVTRLPIVAAESTTNGWRDLVVHVSGGGILPGYDALLRFDGIKYPENPTVGPAQPLKAEGTGRVLIPRFASFTEGELLWPRP